MSGSTVDALRGAPLPARPMSAFVASADERPERFRRAAITRTEWSHGPCRRRAQSHATTLPPSSDAICRSSAPQKVHTVFLVSSAPPLKRTDFYQMVLHRPVEPAPVFSKFKLLGGF